MHNGLINTAKVNSNLLISKIYITNRISIISKNFYDFLVDTNDFMYEYNLSFCFYCIGETVRSIITNIIFYGDVVDIIYKSFTN